MKTASFIPVLSVIIAVTGCALEGADPEVAREDELGRADSALGRRRRDDPFFTEAHPQTGTFVTSAGQEVPLPVPFYDLTGWVVYGTIDAGAAMATTADTGYTPWLTDDGRAFGMFFIQNVYDSGLRPYRSTEFYVLASQPGGYIPWVNQFTAMVPGFIPTTTMFLVDGVLDGDRAFRTYREYFGIDARRATVLTIESADRMTFLVAEEGSATAFGRLPNTVSPADQGAAAVGLAAAFGLPGPEYLPPTPPELRFSFAFRSLECDLDCVRTYHVFSKPNVSFRAFDDRDLLWFGSTPFAESIEPYDFEPMAVMVNAHAMDVADLDP